MLRQRPDHLLHVVRQPFSRTYPLPAFGEIAAAEDRALRALGTVPMAGRLVCRRNQHRRSSAGQKNKIVEIIARKPVFRALPALPGSLVLKNPRALATKYKILAAWRAADVVDVQIVDAAADILPTLAAIEAADDPAMLQTDVKNVRIIRMDENMAHMLSVRRLRIGPFGFHLRGQILNARKLLPALTAVFSSVEMDRLDTDVYDALIGRVHRHGANVAFEYAAPTLAGIIGAIEAVSA